MSECPFCDVPEDEILLENDLCFARWDKYPVSRGHLLIIPFRHFANYFDATEEEITDLWKLVHAAKRLVREQHSPDGYNIGVNVGRDAGQSVPHVHVHLIPRYQGDTDDPFGGIRGVVPGGAHYPR
jgi:diadenosine tetraphosphate (Ap4A) HIT family hydrolase